MDWTFTWKGSSFYLDRLDCTWKVLTLPDRLDFYLDRLDCYLDRLDCYLDRLDFTWMGWTVTWIGWTVT